MIIFCIVCNINIPRPEPQNFDISFRKIKDIDIYHFMTDVVQADFGSNIDTVDE